MTIVSTNDFLSVFYDFAFEFDSFTLHLCFIYTVILVYVIVYTCMLLQSAERQDMTELDKSGISHVVSSGTAYTSRERKQP